MRNIKLIGAPCDLTGRISGSAQAPDRLRKAGLLKHLESMGNYVDDVGNISFPPRIHPDKSPPNGTTMIEVRSQLSKLSHKCKEIIDSNNTALVVGGDHSISKGSITGALNSEKLLNKTLGVIWIDAHADLNTEKTSPSGNPHGMVAASLLGENIDSLNINSSKFLNPKNLLGIGYSEVDAGETLCLKNLNIPHVNAEDIIKKDLSITKNSINEISKKCDFLWISFDLDVILKEESPGVDTDDGLLSYKTISEIIKYIPKENLIGMDLVEFNPKKDLNNRSENLAIEIIKKILD